MSAPFAISLDESVTYLDTLASLKTTILNQAATSATASAAALIAANTSGFVTSSILNSISAANIKNALGQLPVMPGDSPTFGAVTTNSLSTGAVSTTDDVTVGNGKRVISGGGHVNYIPNAPADQKYSRFYAPSDGLSVVFDFVNDGYTISTPWMVVKRSGTTATDINFSVLPTVGSQGKLVLENPATPYSIIAQENADAFLDWDARWWDSSVVNGVQHNWIAHASGAGDLTFGLYQPTSTTFSMWMSVPCFAVYFETWKLALTNNNASLAAYCAGRMETQWAHVKNVFSVSSLQTGNGGICYTVDDGAWYLHFLRMVADYYYNRDGIASTEGNRAFGYAVECLPYLCNRFMDPLQVAAGNIYNYNYSTPGLGTAFKSCKYGLLYPNPTDPTSVATYGYVSSSIEGVFGDVACWISQQPVTTAAAKTAYMAYAVNTQSWLQTYLKTPEQGTGKNAAGLYCASLNLDPNVNKANNTSINGGNPQAVAGNGARGGYDTNQVYLQPQDNYYGPGIRGLTNVWDSATQAISCLNYSLFVASGNQSYATEALSIITGMSKTNGLVRDRAGVPFLGNIRDPHSAGVWLPRIMRLVATLPGFDSTNIFQSALLNSARKTMMSRRRGLFDPNWSGSEYLFVDGTYLWEDTSGLHNGGGGQAKPEQEMVSASGPLLGIAATYCNETVCGSGIGAADLSVRHLPFLYAAVRQIFSEVMTLSGGNFTDTISVKDTNFRLDNVNGNPFLNLDNQAGVARDRTNNATYLFDGNVARMTTSAAGTNIYFGLTAYCPVLPSADNLWSLGSSSLRFSQVYAATGTIQTSDERFKTWRGTLNDTEVSAGREIASQIGVFRYNDDITTKGADGARLHVGVLAQKVWAIMASYQLVDPATPETASSRYAFLCYDAWDATEAVPAIEANIEKGIVAVPEKPGQEAGYRFGIRYDELSMFVSAAQEIGMKALEARLAALEVKSS